MLWICGTVDKKQARVSLLMCICGYVFTVRHTITNQTSLFNRQASMSCISFLIFLKREYAGQGMAMAPAGSSVKLALQNRQLPA